MTMTQVLDLQYRMFNRMRHRRAFEVAREAGVHADFEGLRGARQALLVTFKRTGEPVPTPVNFGLDDDGRTVYIRTESRMAKVKRVQNDPRVRICASSFRGKPKGPMIEGVARVLPPEEHDRAYAAIAANWSAAMRPYERVADRAPVDLAYLEVTPA